MSCTWAMAWTIAVTSDEKSMRTLSMSVSGLKVTVMARPEGWVAPEPDRSPMPTCFLFAWMIAVRPFSAATLSISPLAKATSTVVQGVLEYAKSCIFCPSLRPTIVPCVLVLASERPGLSPDHSFAVARRRLFGFKVWQIECCSDPSLVHKAQYCAKRTASRRRTSPSPLKSPPLQGGSFVTPGDGFVNDDWLAQT